MKEKTKKIINTVFLLLILASIVIGFTIGSVIPQGGETVLKYGNFKFSKKGNFWSTYINNKEALFVYYPTDVADIAFDEKTVSLLINRFEIDSTSDFNDTLKEGIAYSQYELGNMMKFHFDSYLRVGFSANNSFNMPVITCSQATEAVPVIYFQYGNSTKIVSENNCIIAAAQSRNEIVRIKDRILYTMLGILR